MKDRIGARREFDNGDSHKKVWSLESGV
jgi:hypothetical protein